VEISAQSGMLFAVNRPPGCGAAIGTMDIGRDGSPGGLNLTEATSNVVVGAAAGGACADAVAAVSSVTAANTYAERTMFIPTSPSTPESSA
jgi:hypothetical protein